MDKQAILDLLQTALTEYQVAWDEGQVTISSVDIEEPGPVLRLTLSNGENWLISTVEG